ncbi:hypothetical protein DPMN_187564 [Dreissena polymorpha]|uniref:Uncharacterized protein n=2 Tax=Dreissena polymorpha TaxID=45954 RepID=A0A9D4DPQ4_DREPO|nr:hypothetical protein DPMN_187564 [Dreissena polymorpha]
MEVKTAITLLEQFQKFECCKERFPLCNFLQQKEDKINESPFFKLLQQCPKLEHLRCGSVWQQHLEQSLRSLEENNYQVKRFLYTVTHNDETLLLRLRDRYERFYGEQIDKYQFTFGLGLKPLMNAMQSKETKHRVALDKRVVEAKQNLVDKVLKQKPDIRDLLVYVGYSIITFSNRSRTSKRPACSGGDYITLLKCSTMLLSLQREMQLHRKYLESYLYFAMLHWPLQQRIQTASDSLVSGDVYEEVMKEWDTEYDKNHFIKKTEQSRLKKPKNYYALGKGVAGKDIVDLESIKKEWRDRKKTNGRTLPPVFRDFFWMEPFVEDELQRLQGVVDGNGRLISHTAAYSNKRQHTFKIKTYYPCDGFCNRQVTFVLGFSWKGPTSFDVRPIESSCSADNNDWSDSLSPGLVSANAQTVSKDVSNSDHTQQDSFANQTRGTICDRDQPPVRDVLSQPDVRASAESDVTASGCTMTASSNTNEQHASGSHKRRKRKNKMK